jgi:two-component system chemotaxis response regulator CheB
MTTDAVTNDLRSHGIAAIAMGGSAGGIDALRAVLPALPVSLPIPVFVVLHLSAASKGAWSVVFSQCKLPVREAEDKDIAEPGTVYIAPPDYHLLVHESGTMALSIEEQVHLSRPSIDVLFESAAMSYGRRLLGILFSGANADGAAGLAAIHRAGGLCWIQSPETAAVAAMPRAAIVAVPDARVLSLKQMADAFHAWRR